MHVLQILGSPNSIRQIHPKGLKVMAPFGSYHKSLSHHVDADSIPRVVADIWLRNYSVRIRRRRLRATAMRLDWRLYRCVMQQPIINHVTEWMSPM